MASEWVVEVGFKPDRFDALGQAIKQGIRDDLGIRGISAVSYVEAYSIPVRIEWQKVLEIAEKLLCDPVSQEFSLNEPLRKDFEWVISVLYKSDVTDNVGIAAEEGIRDLGLMLREGESVRTIRKYYLKGSLSTKHVNRIVSGMLANDLIENYSIRKCKEWAKK